MRGLVGLITKMPRPDAVAKLLRMVAALRRGASDKTGVWSNESLGIYAAWTERSGEQSKYIPLRNEGHDLTLLISGEVFLDQVACSSQSSQIMQAAETDPCFPKRLNGLFHGILADEKDKRVILFNDRYGMHRLYYRETADAFLFGSEAKAILAVDPEARAVDTSGLAQFISCGCTLENRTIFKGVSSLPGASAWMFQAGSLTLKGRYFSPREWEDQLSLDPESYYQQLKAVFAERVPRYFEGAERVGISLTGGLDSRMLMSWSRAAPGTLRCFTFGGAYRESQDVKIARRVAETCGQNHEVINVGRRFLADFPRYAEQTVFLTDGCVAVKHAPDLYVSEQAACIAPVRVTGNYGGEVLRQVRTFKSTAPSPGLFAPGLGGELSNAKEIYSGLLEAHPLSFAVFNQAPWRQYGLLALESTQQKIRSPFLDNEIVQVAYRAPKNSPEDNYASLQLITDGNRALRAIRTDRGLGGSLPGWASALRRMYFETTFRAEYAWDYGMPDCVVRADHALKGLHLERRFLGRHKFTHFRVWYRDELSDYVREILLDTRALSRTYLERGAVQRIVAEHCEGRGNHTDAIHKLLTLEHIHRLFID
jgi:asparagine synthase (glutamine-hydrolysing)